MTLFPKIKKTYAILFHFLALMGSFIILINTIFPFIYIAKAINQIEGTAECVMELNSRRILYERKGDMCLPMASTTKILTAITVLENASNLNEEIRIPPQAVGIEGSSVYLKEGDIYSIKDLLYGLMLRSGNDCATALAFYIAGNINNFSKLMNLTAQKAGALNSSFINPHGLPNDDHKTTARDLCYITCYAMKNPIYCDIVSTKYYQPRNWTNKNKLLTLYEYATGGKTGYTKEAGRCLVSSAQKDNMTLICSILNCSTTYERTMELFNDAFSHYKNITILSKDTPLKIEQNGKIYTAYVEKDYVYPLLKEEEEFIEINTSLINKSLNTIKKDEIIGNFKIYFLKQLLFSGNLYKL